MYCGFIYKSVYKSKHTFKACSGSYSSSKSLQPREQKNYNSINKGYNVNCHATHPSHNVFNICKGVRKAVVTSKYYNKIFL